QPRARLALHGRRLPGHRGLQPNRLVPGRGGVRARGHAGHRHAGGGERAPHPLRARSPGPGPRHLRPDPLLQRGRGHRLAALGGAMAGPIYSVLPGMGEEILIQVFVVIVIGGIGSIRGALVGAVVVGMVDTLGRAFLKPMLSTVIGPSAADNAGPALASMLIYILMAAVLFFRPQGLFPAARG